VSTLRLGSGAPWEAVVGYSRVVVVGDAPWVSGTTATVDGEVVHSGEAGAQQKDLVPLPPRKPGGSLWTRPDAVRTRIYVTDVGAREAVGRVHGECFGSIRPATSMVQVAAIIDPAMLVELEADAVRGAGA
jgi:enamine deaminase RidA (YjgF/YER057c/UK114 family)